MRRSRAQRGEGQMGCLVGLVMMAIGIFVAYKMIPIKVRAAELRGEVVDQSKSAGMRSDKQIMAAILHRAQENNLPVTEDNVKINRGQNNIVVDVDYTIPVDFPGYVYQWHFNHHAENPIF